MRLRWFVGKLKKNRRFLVLLVVLFAFGYFSASHNFLSMKRNNQPNDIPRVKHLDVSEKIQYYRRLISSLTKTVQAERNNTRNVISAIKDQVKPKNESNISYHVIYSEKEMQVQLKAIHEKGKELIKLKQSKCHQRLPQCLIIGNYKSGTQELLEFMSMHPRIRIYREPLFELNFFAGNYHKGLEWYKKQMPCSFDNQITIEKSACYFQEPESPVRIREMNSSIKLIVMVREPITRAFAHFSFSKHVARKYGYNFDSCAIDASSGAVNRDCFAIKHSIYDEGMERYLQLFNKDQIKIIDGDDFKRDPHTVLHDIEAFLDIEHIIERKSLVFIKEKGFHCLRSIRKSSFVTCYDKNRGRTGKTQIRNSINNTTMKKLEEFFEERNDRFFQQINRTFNWKYRGF